MALRLHLLHGAKPVFPIPQTVAACPVFVIAAGADPATPHYGGVALARAVGSSVNLLTGSGEDHLAFECSPCVAEQLPLYLVEPRVSGGHAC